MIGSTTPLAARPDWHPVHRANALLRQALLNSAATPGPTQIWDTEPPHPFGISSGFDALADDDLGAPEPAEIHGPDFGEADASRHERTARSGVTDRTELQGLIGDFYKRQRQASLLVICSLAAAFLLTLCGLVLLFSFVGSETEEIQAPAPKHGTSVAGEGSGTAPIAMPRISVRTNRAAKSASLFLAAKADRDTRALQTGAQVILATAGRPLALSPLLPLGSARYLLLRGLPPGAELSAGQRTGTGTWMVKDEEAGDLTLTVGEDATGDYPLEVYQLDAVDIPQARRSLVLRVEAPIRAYAAGLAMGWPTALIDAAFRTPATAKPPTPADPAALLARARRTLSEGDIAAARLILQYLAERGEPEAAYEFARTFDQDMLEEFGARGVDGDLPTALAWYERAAQEGHAKAAQRLKILASLPDGGQAD